jgi:hypothetical protein
VDPSPTSTLLDYFRLPFGGRDAECSAQVNKKHTRVQMFVSATFRCVHAQSQGPAIPATHAQRFGVCMCNPTGPAIPATHARTHARTRAHMRTHRHENGPSLTFPPSEHGQECISKSASRDGKVSTKKCRGMLRRRLMGPQWPERRSGVQVQRGNNPRGDALPVYCHPSTDSTPFIVRRNHGQKRARATTTTQPQPQCVCVSVCVHLSARL